MIFNIFRRKKKVQIAMTFMLAITAKGRDPFVILVPGTEIQAKEIARILNSQIGINKVDLWRIQLAPIKPERTEFIKSYISGKSR